MIEMDRATFVETHGKFCDNIKEITAAKNADYTGASDDPFFNLSTVERMQISSTETGILTRMTDKFTRVISLLKVGSAKVKDESIEDTLLDFANYCILLACYIRSKRT